MVLGRLLRGHGVGPIIVPVRWLGHAEGLLQDFPNPTELHGLNGQRTSVDSVGNSRPLLRRAGGPVMEHVMKQTTGTRRGDSRRVTSFSVIFGFRSTF